MNNPTIKVKSNNDGTFNLENVTDKKIILSNKTEQECIDLKKQIRSFYIYQNKLSNIIR